MHSGHNNGSHPDNDGGADASVSLVLHEAAGAGDLQRILWCVAHGADVNWANSADHDSTALHKACARGALVCVEFLFQQGANLQAVDSQQVARVTTNTSNLNLQCNDSMFPGQCTPLDTALLNNHIQLLDLLQRRLKLSE